MISWAWAYSPYHTYQHKLPKEKLPTRVEGGGVNLVPLFTLNLIFEKAFWREGGREGGPVTIPDELSVIE